MKIAKVSEDRVTFDNGNYIDYDHSPDCCECNYADFSILTENLVHYNYDFDENLNFEFIGDEGFRFGSDGRWIFVPCYSEQNGYYSTDIDIYYNGKRVLNGDCKFVYR